ncbi:hypothetical protein BJ138DRAFT_1012902 [Hygrophoropsis aurantiaca]|uniref:Uncharacterized protein n=1 Tax=Hygrophoropsis aurantiaca TaxID=72124 RepID=A0ACB8A4K5_9AGAM|nr:hypothetical protein BJ138DRAFT_1012902 [Hygrophoropsis aurantiaca]
MNVFNPRILDASIRDVTASLTDEQKADVLLYALQHLPAEGMTLSCRCRTLVENAVQSYLQINNLPPTDIARARILRAKTRLTAGYRTSAQHDLLAVLAADSDNQEVKSIIHSEHLRPEMLLCEPGSPPRFSAEVWREIALFLPRKDLKSLLLVPHALSRIASQLLFCEIDLHFTSACPESNASRSIDWLLVDKELEAWHYQRSADILTRILVDATFASHIRSLRVYAAPADVNAPIAFQTGMLLNALPKLLSLCNVYVSGGQDLLLRTLQAMHTFNPRLRSLSLNLIDRSGHIEIPVFKHLTHFALTSEVGDSAPTYTFLAQSRDTLRALSVRNPHWNFPSDVITIRHLTHIDFNGNFPSDNQAFSDILSYGHQLETLSLSGVLDCMPSSAFRAHTVTTSDANVIKHTFLPFLRHFAFKITNLHRHVTDRDLIPAVCAFVRGRTNLQTFQLLIPANSEQRWGVTVDLHRRIGFDASAWGVLPSLTGLKSLSIAYPRDLAPSLAGWLIPRSVKALSVDFVAPPASAEDLSLFMEQLHPGISPHLTYFGLTNFPTRSVLNVIERGFQDIRVVRVERNLWTITRFDDGAVEIDQWPQRKVRYHAVEWLEAMGCGDAVWHGVGRVDVM